MAPPPILTEYKHTWHAQAYKHRGLGAPLRTAPPLPRRGVLLLSGARSAPVGPVPLT
jgi:hypothetical protein